jgi:Tol biopolymer transport system component
VSVPAGIGVALKGGMSRTFGFRCVVMVLAATGSAASPQEPGAVTLPRTHLASDSAEGIRVEPTAPAISADGRVIAFVTNQESTAVTGDGLNVFVRDMTEDAARQVARAGGVDAAWVASEVAISADGNWLGVIGNDPDAFPVPPSLLLVHRPTGDARLIAAAHETALSADGRYIAIVTLARLAPGDENDHTDVVVYDQVTGTYDAVTEPLDAASAAENLSVSLAGISSDGRFVGFWGCSPRYVPDDTNGACDVFVRDRTERTTRRVSVHSDGTQGNSDSVDAALSADGGAIAFVSAADNLVPSDKNAQPDVFVHDLRRRATARVNVNSFGAESPTAGQTPAISGDGRHVAFDSFDTDLVVQPSRGSLFVHDRQSGVTRQVDVEETGRNPEGGSGNAAVSATGRFIAFWTTKPLTAGDADSELDVYVRDQGTATPRDHLETLTATVRDSVSGPAFDALAPILDRAGAAEGRGDRPRACRELATAMEETENAWGAGIRNDVARELLETGLRLANELGCLTFGSRFAFDRALFRSAPTNLFSVNTADFDRDGFADAVVSGFGGLSVFLGDGTGSVRSRIDVPALMGRGLSTPDVDADGRPDMVLANQGDDSISVFLNRAHEGTPFVRIDLPVGPVPAHAAAGDMTGDGLVDLVVAQAGATDLALLAGRSPVGFEPMVAIPLGYGSRNVVVADFDGDGVNDLAASGNGAISVLIGDGEGGFSFPTHWAFGDFYRLLAGDVNADGLPDLVAGSSDIQVLLNAGGGSFDVMPTLPIPGVLGMALGDFDTDGRLDIAASSTGSQTWILRGHNDGTFGHPQAVAPGAFDLAAADMNGDGAIDVLGTQDTSRGQFPNERPIGNLMVLVNRPAVFVTSPNQPVSWSIGSEQAISWLHRLDVRTPFRLEVSRDEGASWSAIGELVSRGRQARFIWTVDGPAADRARVRVVSAGTDGRFDVANGPVRIEEARLAFTHPQAGSRWAIGGANVLQWVHNLSTRERVNVDVSRDNGLSWSSVASNVQLKGSSASTFVWTASGPPGSAVFRVTWTKDPRVSATSPAVSIEVPAIRLTSPARGTSWPVCVDVPIRWQHNLGTQERVKVEISRDGGGTWTPVAANVRNTGALRGSFFWEANGGASVDGRVRVSWLRDPSVFGVSESVIFDTRSACDPPPPD